MPIFPTERTVASRIKHNTDRKEVNRLEGDQCSIQNPEKCHRRQKSECTVSSKEECEGDLIINVIDFP